MKNLITCLSVCVLSGATFADTWTVDDDGKADFDNIQAAVDAASNGDEIIVMPGTYTGTGDEVVDMLGKSVTLRSSNGPNVTFIDGETQRRGIICQGEEANNTLIEGFKIINCIGLLYDYNGTMLSIGGGILCVNAASPSLSNCIMSFNSADYGGGLFAGQGSQLELVDCTFTYGTAVVAGGALYLHFSNSNITECYFSNSSANNSGGAMISSNSAPSLTDCNFNGNTAAEFGGALSSYNSNITLSNSTFTGNSSVNGGAMYYAENSGAVVNGCTFTNNSAINVGGGLSLNESNPDIVDCVFDSNNANNYFGGGIYCWLSNPEIVASTFIGNTAVVGGGILCNNYSSPTISECLITENTAVDYGGGVHLSVGSIPLIEMTTICGNEPDQLTFADSYQDGGGNIIEDTCPADCLGDISGDNHVDVTDLLIVIAYWGSNSSNGDVNFDGIVDVSDLLIVVGNWGPCE